jgi:23S rRNA (guanosine2251-2'-O)-methyltransferase
MNDRPHRPRGRDHGRNAFPPRSRAERQADRIWVYGIHPVAAALANPRRTIHRLLATDNALRRLAEMKVEVTVPTEPASPRDLDRLLGEDAVHQGVAVEAGPLPEMPLSELAKGARLVLVLDQVTDPHNVGAILRSASAMAADAVIATGRHSPTETGVLAKSASGALDVLPFITVQNLARALNELGELGFHRIGLDSEGAVELEDALGGERLALVLGAEGKGLRQLTRETCDVVARLELPGAIQSLNVSNAGALALYLASRSLRRA